MGTVDDFIVSTPNDILLFYIYYYSPIKKISIKRQE